MNTPDDLVCVTSHFNPAKYVSRLSNYYAFRETIGIPLLTIECAFGDASFELPESAMTMRVRARDVMWQKERLLNLAVARLPARFTKIAWVDADISFENLEWARHAAALLDRCEIVQLFEQAIRLAPKPSEQLVTQGFAAKCSAQMPPLDPLYCFHGDPGFAWAARRELFEHGGLYDACIGGGADHMIAHALHGWHGSPCITRNLRGAHLEHYDRWASALHERVDHRVGFVPGKIRHHWHGSRANRRYSDRHEILASFGFDPARDLRINTDGCWEWTDPPQALRDWIVQYFVDRREDDT